MKNKLGIAWASFLLLAAGFLFFRSFSGLPLETNILKLLPKTESDPLSEQAYAQFERASSRKTVFLVGGGEREKAVLAAQAVYAQMVESELFESISFEVNPERTRQIYDVYFPHRNKLLSDQQRLALLKGEPGKIAERAVKSLMSPVSIGSAGLSTDPLFTFQEFLMELQSEASTFSLDENLVWTESPQGAYIVIVGVLKDNAFSLTAQAQFGEFYESAKNQAKETDSQLLSAGVIHHAMAGAQSARRDISTIGFGSLLGLFALMLIAFRSLRPLVVSTLPILAGCLAALAVCVLVFEKVHLITLVFGSSLIGVSIDYSFHFFAERLGAGQSWNAQRGLRNIFPGISLGLLTSLAAYLSLAIAPFSGLRQIALFSSVGLTAAYISVVVWYPALLSKPGAVGVPWTLTWSRSYLKWWPTGETKAARYVLVLCCVVMSIYLGLTLRADDDVRSFQSSPQRVIDEEELVKSLVGTSSGSQFFIVRGDNEDDVLIAEEKLISLLDKQVAEGALAGYRAISKVLPSATRQRENYELLRSQALDPESPFSGYLTEMGFEDQIIESYRKAFLNESPGTLSVEEWLASPFRDLYGDLWMQTEDGQSASILILDGVTQLNSLRALGEELDGATFVSRADDVSELLKRYRKRSTKLVAAAYFAIFMLLLFRYSREEAVMVILPPLTAGLVALTVSSLLGVAVNLFNTLALILVLGIGIDYTIFFAEKPEDRGTTMHAVFLSAVTSILSFGLLALSGTPVLSSFGLVVLVGISVSMALAPVAGRSA